MRISRFNHVHYRAARMTRQEPRSTRHHYRSDTSLRQSQSPSIASRRLTKPLTQRDLKRRCTAPEITPNLLVLEENNSNCTLVPTWADGSSNGSSPRQSPSQARYYRLPATMQLEARSTDSMATTHSGHAYYTTGPVHDHDFTAVSRMKRYVSKEEGVSRTPSRGTWPIMCKDSIHDRTEVDWPLSAASQETFRGRSIRRQPAMIFRAPSGCESVPRTCKTPLVAPLPTCGSGRALSPISIKALEQVQIIRKDSLYLDEQVSRTHIHAKVQERRVRWADSEEDKIEHMHTVDSRFRWRSYLLCSRSH